jgi:hypothetical protein
MSIYVQAQKIDTQCRFQRSSVVVHAHTLVTEHTQTGPLAGSTHLHSKHEAEHNRSTTGRIHIYTSL